MHFSHGAEGELEVLGSNKVVHLPSRKFKFYLFPLKYYVAIYCMSYTDFFPYILAVFSFILPCYYQSSSMQNAELFSKRAF